MYIRYRACGGCHAFDLLYVQPMQELREACMHAVSAFAAQVNLETAQLQGVAGACAAVGASDGRTGLSEGELLEVCARGALRAAVDVLVLKRLGAGAGAGVPSIRQRFHALEKHLRDDRPVALAPDM